MQPKLRITGLVEEKNNKQMKLNKYITPKCANFYKGKIEFTRETCSGNGTYLDLGLEKGGGCQVVSHDLYKI